MREATVLKSVLKTLQLHPKIAWAARMNVGMFRLEGRNGSRVFKAGFAGLSDIIGQLKDGRFLACECKRPGKDATPHQAAFLAEVERHGGLSFVARSAGDVIDALSRHECG